MDDYVRRKQHPLLLVQMVGDNLKLSPLQDQVITDVASVSISDLSSCSMPDFK